VSRENIELVRRLYAELASEGSTEEFEQRMSDDALGRFLDPEIEWGPVTESLLAVDSYCGFDGVRRFWSEFLSAWERHSPANPHLPASEPDLAGPTTSPPSTPRS
jgi:hypothetical protein